MAFVRDPGVMRDEHAVAELEAMTERIDDGPAQKRLRRWLLDLRRPSAASREQAFIEHATAWADRTDISADACIAEGVPAGSCDVPDSAAGQAEAEAAVQPPRARRRRAPGARARGRVS